MKTTKMSLATMQGKMSREEMKSLLGGREDALGEGLDCLPEFSYGCSTSTNDCCVGQCEMNGTNSGTICVVR